MAGAVILPKDETILYLNDSKKLSEKKREELYDVLMEKAVAPGIGIASPAGHSPERCGNNSGSYDSTGSHYQRGCQKRFYCGGKYHCKGDKRQTDGGI